MNESRVWIELDKDQENVALNHERAKKLSAVLMHLWGCDYEPIYFSDRDFAYRFKTSECGSYLVLNDSGHWFSLDYMEERIKQLEMA